MIELLPNGKPLNGGKYLIGYPLERGQFSVIYLALEIRTGKTVVVKELFPLGQVQRDDLTGAVVGLGRSDETFQRSLKRFSREGRMLAEIEHPHVVRVADCFEENGTAYLVMEMIEGGTLRNEMEAARGVGLPESRVRNWMKQLVSALEAIHEKGLCHLDIRPENVMIRKSDGSAVLAGFNAARWVGLSADVTQTLTPAYTPPEIIAGGSNDDIGAHSDLYELGMMLHEMLTGRLATDRLVKGDNWEPAKLTGVWRTAVVEATRLHWGQRPLKARDWWQTITQNQAAGHRIEINVSDAAAARLDPAEAEAIIRAKIAANDFDVFLCHNRRDKPAVKEIGRSLRARGILPWLDEEQLRPGLPWQRALEKQIKRIKAAAVFVGRKGIGPWQRNELDGFLREFVERGCPVIPVILQNCSKEPNLPLFLKSMTWVDFRQPSPNPMESLIWGITGERH
jgi:serine/threonine protein kinase